MALYFVLNRYTQNVKIGYSHNVESRIRNLSLQSGIELELIYSMSGSSSDENRLHRLFKDKIKFNFHFQTSYPNSSIFPRPSNSP